MVSNKSGIQTAKSSSTSNYTTTSGFSQSNNSTFSVNSRAKAITNSTEEIGKNLNKNDNKLSACSMQGFDGISDQHKSLKDERKRNETKASKILICKYEFEIENYSNF